MKTNLTSGRGKFLVPLIAAATGLLVSFAVAGPASASPSKAAAPSGSGKYCAVLVTKAATPDAVSPMLSRACSNTSMASAHATMAADAPDGVAVPDAGAELMTWYENSNYGGSSTNIYAGGVIGGGSTCDTAGYTLTPDYAWAYNISSAKGHGNCSRARFVNTESNYALTFALPIAYIGDRLNDDVGTIHVYQG
jgi:hypothetical protein